MSNYIGIDLGAYQIRIYVDRSQEDWKFLSWVIETEHEDRKQFVIGDNVQEELALDQVKHNFFKGLKTNEQQEQLWTQCIFEEINNKLKQYDQRDIVAVVPSYFDNLDKQKLITIAKQKDIVLNSSYIVSQGLAKAAFLAQTKRLTSNSIFAIFDLGASQFEFSVFEVLEQYHIKQIESFCSININGYSINKKIWDIVAEKYQKDRGKNLDEKVFYYLDQQIEDMRQGFCTYHECSIRIPEKRPTTVNVNQNEFLTAIQPMLDHCFDEVNKILKEYPVKSIYLTGGVTNLEYLMQYIKELMCKPLNLSKKPADAVFVENVYKENMAAKGVTLYIQQLEEQQKEEQQRKAEEVRRKAEEEAEEKRRLGEAEAKRRLEHQQHLAELEHQRQLADAKRQAEVDDQRKVEEEAVEKRRLEEVEVKRQLEHQQHLAELEHQRQIAEAKRQAEAEAAYQARRKQIEQEEKRKGTIGFFKGLGIGLILLPIVISLVIAGLVLAFEFLRNFYRSELVNFIVIAGLIGLGIRINWAVLKAAYQRFAKWGLSLGLSVYVLLSLIAVGIGIDENNKYQYSADNDVADAEVAARDAMLAAEDAERAADAAAEEVQAAVPVAETAVVNNEQVNPPNLQVGMRWNIKTIDLRRPQDSFDNVEFTLTDVDNHYYHFNKILKGRSNKITELTYNHSLNLLYSSATGTYSPALAYYDFPLYTGKTWHIESNVSNNKYKDTQISEGEVLGWETISSPYWQDMKTLKIQVIFDTYKDGKLINHSLDVSWYSPDIGRAIKSEEYAWDDTTSNWQKAREHYVFNFENP